MKNLSYKLRRFGEQVWNEPVNYINCVKTSQHVFVIVLFFFTDGGDLTCNQVKHN